MSLYNTGYSVGTTSAGLANNSTATSTTSGYAVYQAHKRQRTDDGAKDPAAADADKLAIANASSATGSTTITTITSTTNSTGPAYPPMSLSLQKDASWSILGDVDNFGGLGPIPSMSTVLEKRQFSISSLLPPGMTTASTNGVSMATAPTTDRATGQPAAQVIEGSGGNQKFLDQNTGEYMYGESVKPMTFAEKQQLVQKITLLPSQYLRGLMDVISKYQPDTVRQIDDDGYAFDLGQMNENTVWAISDYVKDSMIELDGYIRSISAANIGEDGQATGGLDPNSLAAQQQALGRHPAHELTLNNPKISAISNNENQGKFLEQVEMYSKPKITKSLVKPSKKHECPTCQKQFRGRSELQNHLRTHSGEKPLKCSFAGCQKRYAHSSNLRAHERTHAGVKPYACHYDGCGKSFAHSVSLKEHIWMHAGFQPYVCPYEGCEKKFTQVSNFARHKKTHEKDERRDAGASNDTDN